MYVRNYRGLVPSIALIGGTIYPSSTVDQETYSWRTGRRARKHDVIIPPSSNSTANLTAKLTSRKDYIEDLGSNLVSQNAAPFQEINRWLTHDTGHQFSTVRRTLVGHASQRVNGKLQSFGSARGTFGNYAFVPPLVTTSYMTARSNWNGNGVWFNLGPTDAKNRLDAQRMFSSADPDKSLAGLGETIVELISGNMPKALTTLGRNIASGKIFYQKLRTNLKDTGSDYLNQQFGWAPLMRDFTAIIEDLLKVHHFLYESSYRRSRYTWPERIYKQVPMTSLGLGTAYVRKDSDSAYTSIRTPPGYVADITYSYDTILSARFTRARPSNAGNAFVDRAYELLHKYGVATPQLSWDLLPYSWLVDWALHLGRGIQNYSTYSKDGRMKTDYAYATTKSLFHIAGQGFDYKYRQSPSVLQHYQSSYWSETHTSTYRRQATPFGFALDLTGLSSAQYGILVALGLARMR